MKRYDTVIFDLDGTLENPESGLVSSFKYALGKMGVDYGTLDSLKRFIGPPLYSEWRRVFGFSEDEGDVALGLFHEYYSVFGWWDCEVYRGIHELLGELKGRGFTLAVATSKPEFFAEKVLSRFGLRGYFDFVGAADGDRQRDKKHEVLEYVFENLGCKRERSVMVGDRVFDADGARKCGIDAVGVLWGHGSREELDSSGFVYIAENPTELISFLEK